MWGVTLYTTISIVAWQKKGKQVFCVHQRLRSTARGSYFADAVSHSGALAADSDRHFRCTRTIQRPLVCFFHVLVAHMSRCRL